MATGASENPAVFTCWKEIAFYLGKGVRTVQRWENEFGLPVQRPDMKSKGTVRASRQELDLWLQGHWGSRAFHGPVAAVSDIIQQSRRLREERRRIIAELQNSVHALAELGKQWQGASTVRR